MNHTEKTKNNIVEGGEDSTDNGNDERVVGKDTTAFRDSDVLGMDKDSIFEGDLTLTDIHARILEHEGHILKDCDVDDLLGLSKDSFGEASAICKLVDLTLSSDGEHDITVISSQNRTVASSPPAGEAKGTQSKLSDEGCSLGANDAKIVRQAAVEKSPSASPRDISKAGRTKLDRAKNGTRKSLAFLAKMKQRDPTSFSAKEKYLLKRHRQDVARFERIHGPVSVLLGGSSLEELQSADVVGLDVRPSTSANCRLDKRKEGGAPAAEALRASVGAADGSKTPPKKVPGVRGSKKPPAASLKGSQSGAFKRIGSGGGQASSLKEPKSSAVMDAAGTDPTGITSGSRNETIKRARSGDDQPHSSTKKLKKSLSLEGHLHAAVIDRNDPDGKISTDLWQLVESRLLDEIAAYSGSPDDVSFKGADWAKGVKIVNCGNKNSFEFLRATVAKLGDLGQDTKLEVIQSSELPLRSIVTVWIPPPVRPVETILAVLAKQNGNLLTDQWKYVTSMVCKENTGRDFRFAVDGKSLEFLDRVRGVANFGLGTVRFRYSKQNRSKEAAGGADKPASL